MVRTAAQTCGGLEFRQGPASWCSSLEDPDDSRRIVLHWLVTGIHPACTGISAGETPRKGKVWCNDFGDVGYDGPQPSVGDASHRYFFRVFALARPARLPRHPSGADVHRAIRGTILASGALIGRHRG
jgi:phosphatidylethanolamine-binding protein (PEBP) family uncharacterized protein